LKRKIFLRIVFFRIALAFVMSGLFLPGLAFAEASKVAIIPFKMNAEKDMTFLKDGITDMLTSRLYWEDKVVVMNREDTQKVLDTIAGPLDEGTAREVGKRLGADYILFGSLTVFGESVSMDAKMIDLSGDKPVLAFFNQSRAMSEVIPKIDGFANDINEKVFGRAMPAPEAPVQTRTAGPGMQPDIHTHPEKLIEGGFEGDDQRSGLNPAFIMTQERQKTFQGFWKSQNFSQLFNGLALEDVDGDGRIETILITPHEVYVYKFEGRRFFKTGVVAEDRNRNFIGVDVADINGNGHPEIFVTALNAYKNGVSSFVLENDGKNYKRLVEDSKWYFRVIKHSDRGSILYGQKQGAGGEAAFAGPVHEMSWQNSGYEPANQVLPARRASLMGFAFGDAMNNGQEIAIAYTKSDRIRMIDPSGKETWSSSEAYGGSTLYFAMPKTGPGDPENRQYFPMRLLIGDPDGNGKNEIIAVKNYEVAGRKLTQYRQFTDAQIESLSWDGLGLAVNWATRKTSGYIRDFAVGDFDNDGVDELVAAVIVKDAFIVGMTPKSTVIAYDLKK
jgi:TolB-like protein